MFPTSSRALTGGGLRAEAATTRLLLAVWAFSSCFPYPLPHPAGKICECCPGSGPTVPGQPRAGDAVMGKGSAWCVAGCVCWCGVWGYTQERTGTSCCLRPPILKQVMPACHCVYAEFHQVLTFMVQHWDVKSDKTGFLQSQNFIRWPQRSPLAQGSRERPGDT